MSIYDNSFMCEVFDSGLNASALSIRFGRVLKLKLITFL